MLHFKLNYSNIHSPQQPNCIVANAEGPMMDYYMGTYSKASPSSPCFSLNW